MKRCHLRQLLSFLALAAVLLTASCNNRSIMLRTKRNYPFDELSKIPPTREYKIGINDNIEIQINPNKGAILLENNTSNSSNIKSLTATVEYDGTVKLPALGRVQVKDLTVRELELMLEERFKELFIDPFVKVNIPNKRILIFAGNDGSARVITLTNQNTTLLEAIASNGGITGTAKANRIKLIRGDRENPKVYLINLSTIEGMKQGNIVLQGNDIIYIEPRNDYVINATNRIAPYVAAINIFILLYSITK
jgi:polysaccharide export outer membrane protein